MFPSTLTLSDNSLDCTETRHKDLPEQLAKSLNNTDHMPSGIPKPGGSGLPKATPSLRRTRAMSNLNGNADQKTQAQTIQARKVVAPRSVQTSDKLSQRDFRDLGPPPQPLPLIFAPATPKKLGRTPSLKSQQPLTQLVNNPSKPCNDAASPLSPKHCPAPDRVEDGVGEDSRTVGSLTEEPALLEPEGRTGPLRDSVVDLSTRIQQLASSNHIPPEKLPFLLKLADSCAKANSSTLSSKAKAEIKQDSPPPSPLSFISTHPSGGDHVDYRAVSKVSLLLPDRATDSATPPSVVFPSSHSENKESSPKLRKKRTVPMLKDELLDLENLETALNEAIKIREGVDTIVENLEVELYSRMNEAEKVLLKKGVMGPASDPSSFSSRSDKHADQPKDEDGAPLLSIPAAIYEIPSPKGKVMQNYESERPAPLTESEREDIVRQIREEKNQSQSRSEDARKKGAATMFLARSS